VGGGEEEEEEKEEEGDGGGDKGVMLLHFGCPVKKKKTIVLKPILRNLKS